MTDHEVDRALAAALDVEPRPDFLARVRADVARQPAPSPWPGWWRAAATATAVGVVVVMATLPRGTDAPAPTTADHSRRNLAFDQPTDRSEMSGAAAGIAAVVPASRAVAPKTTGASHSTPAVQIAVVDAEMVRLAIDAAREGLLAPAGESVTSPPLTVSAIDVPLLEVEPLRIVTLAQSGERQ